jgi:2-polyprenyl-3-methyl-5-hydroxy-6-metoxy-1,4-benzoquinol methylase
MSGKMISCPYCGKLGNLYFAIYSRKYYRCCECDLLYRDAPADYDDVVSTYREKFFDRYSTDQLEGQRFKLYDHILKLIREHGKGASLLDVGAGCGFFLAAAQKRGWTVRGIDPSSQSVELARRQNVLDVFHGTLRDYDGNDQFDVITFINVLDHSTMPWVEIARARELLRTGGLIYLRFPNGLLHSRIYRMSQQCGISNSTRKFLVFHEYSFTPKHIKKLLSDHGFVQTIIINSPPSEGDPYGLFPTPILATQVKRIIYSVAKCIEFISFRRLFLGTSLEVIAEKPNYP